MEEFKTVECFKQQSETRMLVAQGTELIFTSPFEQFTRRILCITFGKKTRDLDTPVKS